jgi:hypothetical protein
MLISQASLLLFLSLLLDNFSTFSGLGELEAFMARKEHCRCGVRAPEAVADVLTVVDFAQIGFAPAMEARVARR